MGCKFGRPWNLDYDPEDDSVEEPYEPPDPGAVYYHVNAQLATVMGLGRRRVILDDFGMISPGRDYGLTFSRFRPTRGLDIILSERWIAQGKIIMDIHFKKKAEDESLAFVEPPAGWQFEVKVKAVRPPPPVV